MTLSFWLILLAALIWGLLHSLLASLKAKSMAQRWFGLDYIRWYRLVYNLVTILTLPPVLLLLILSPDRIIYVIPFPWVILTLLIQAGAVLVLLISLRQVGLASFLGLQQMNLSEVNTSSHLVTNGVYHYVRHPFYTTGLVILWLVPLLTWNLLGLIVGFTVYILIGAHFDDRKMLLEYGDAYADYCRQTPMLVPGLHIKHHPEK